MHRQTSTSRGSTLTSTVTLAPGSMSIQRSSSSQRTQFRRIAARRPSIDDSTVSSVSVEADQPSAAIRPWTTFENHINAIHVSEVPLKTKAIGRPPSADFKKVLHEFRGSCEVTSENDHDLGASVSEDVDVRPTAIAKDLATRPRITTQRLAKGEHYARGSKELNLLARSNFCAKGLGPRQLGNGLSKERTCSDKVGKRVPEDSLSSTVSLRRTNITRWNPDCETSENLWKPVKHENSHGKWKGLTVDENIRQGLYERYIERPNSWLEGFVTDSGRRIVEKLAKEGGLQGSDASGRWRRRRSSVEAIRKATA